MNAPNEESERNNNPTQIDEMLTGGVWVCALRSISHIWIHSFSIYELEISRTK